MPPAFRTELTFLHLASPFARELLAYLLKDKERVEHNLK